jgi:drug/metabolite transporter (DMT)-like permease
MTMVDGLAYGLFAAVTWGLTDITAALTTRRLGSLLTLGLVGLASLAGLSAYALATTGGLPFSSPVAARAVVLGVLSAGAYMSFFTALRLGPISVVSPVGSTYGALTVVLAVVLLGERLTGTQAVGALAATSGIILVSLRFAGGPRTARFVGPGVPFAIIACVLWALVTIGTTVLVREVGVASVLLVARSTNVAVVWLVLGLRELLRRSDRVPAPTGPLVRGFVALGLLAGLLDVAGYVAYATGLQQSLAWLVGLSSSFGPAVAVLVAVAFLGDRLRWTQWFGLAVLACGVVLVGLH